MFRRTILRLPICTEKAAEQGDADAQNNLGMLYAQGQGVPKDYVRAYAWFNVSAAQEDLTAQGNRNTAAEKMAPSKLEEAQKLSREYFEKYVVPFREGE